MKDRLVWGRPNVDDNGNLIAVSNCKYCYFYEASGWVRREQRRAYHFFLHVKTFPDTKDCGFYSREPGTDDE